MKSFFDIACLIDVHERRLEQYVGAYQRYLDKLPHLLFIYSAIAIFLMPITRDVLMVEKEVHWLYQGCYGMLLMMLGISVLNAARLMIPGKSLLPVALQHYLETRDGYLRMEMPPDDIDMLVQQLYLKDLIWIVSMGHAMAIRKERYYKRMYLWGVIAIIPYVICLIFNLIYHDFA